MDVSEINVSNATPAQSEEHALMFTGPGQVIMGRCLTLTLACGDLTGVPHGELLVERITGGSG